MKAYTFSIKNENAAMIYAVQHALLEQGYDVSVDRNIYGSGAMITLQKDALEVIRFVKRYCTKNTVIVLTTAEKGIWRIAA